VTNTAKLASQLPPYFAALFQPMSWWPADFLQVVGLLSWEYQPFFDAVRQLHIIAQLPRRRNESPVELAPRIAGDRRLHVADDAISWDEMKALPGGLQYARLGGLSIPLFGGGNDEDALHEVAIKARSELARVLSVDAKLLRTITPYASMRHLRTLREFEMLRDRGASSNDAKQHIAKLQNRKPTAIHGDIQRAMRDLGLTTKDLRLLRNDRRRVKDGVGPPRSKWVHPCPDHGKPMDQSLACDDCRREAEAFQGI
jgi:hypothetical protein